MPDVDTMSLAATERADLLTTFSADRWRHLVGGVGTDARQRCSAVADNCAGLTMQEMRVAQEIAAGATNREAATRLFCSPKTIEYHLTRVYAELGVRSRSALASRLITAIIEPPATPAVVPGQRLAPLSATPVATSEL
jgi:DNA-binding CsgD family transcriptional regulator